MPPGGGQLPAVNVTWEYAQRYVAWLSRMTGKPYRLLTEAEFEYAARAGTQTNYPWGDDIGQNNASCKGCGSKRDNKPAPAGSFAPNAFGLRDMIGNVWQWVEDCYHSTYDGAPTDGSAWVKADCSERVGRSAGWDDGPEFLRVTHRGSDSHAAQYSDLGFRVARALLAP